MLPKDVATMSPYARSELQTNLFGTSHLVCGQDIILIFLLSRLVS